MAPPFLLPSKEKERNGVANGCEKNKNNYYHYTRNKGDVNSLICNSLQGDLWGHLAGMGVTLIQFIPGKVENPSEGLGDFFAFN